MSGLVLLCALLLRPRPGQAASDVAEALESADQPAAACCTQRSSVVSDDHLLGQLGSSVLLAYKIRVDIEKAQHDSSRFDMDKFLQKRCREAKQQAMLELG